MATFRPFPSLRPYRREWLAVDVLAGLSVWAVLVPESLAYATIAGVSPVVGLYAAPPALLLYALVGSSRSLVVGASSATAVLSAAAVGVLATGGPDQVANLTAALAIVTGIFAIVGFLFRLGFVAAFISEPVLKGFVIGLALTIIVGQIPKLLGFDSTAGDFFDQSGHILADLGEVHALSAVVGIATLGAVLVMKRFTARVPAALLVVVIGVVAARLFDLAGRGVAVVGPIDAGLPRFGLPDLAWSDYVGLAGSAVGILLIAFSEGLATAKEKARPGERIDPNRELLGTGLANVGAGLGSGMVVNGSLSKTAVNTGAGGRSQVAGLTAATLVLLTVLFLTGAFESLPEATLAAIVIGAVVDLVDTRSLRRLYRLRTDRLAAIYGPVARPDLIAALAALAGVLFLGTLPGLFVGITVSIALIVYRSSRPHVAILGRLPDIDTWVDVARHPEARTEPRVLVVRPESALFYANADAVHDAVLERVTGETTAVVIDAESVPAVDVSAADMLGRLNEELSERGLRLLLARDVGQVRDVLERAGVRDLVAVFRPTVHQAVAEALGETPPPA